MGRKITYLLGAGASANTIPVVADMHRRISDIISFLKSHISHTSVEIVLKSEISLSDEQLNVIKEIIADLEWLLDEAGNYYTIDTLAKKFFLTNKVSELKRLKRSLIIYFTIEQYLNIKCPEVSTIGYNFRKDSVDKRYSSFIAAITSKRYPCAGGNPDALAAENLPFAISNHIKMLSWNYDMQFELCLKSLLTGTSIQHIKREFQILPNKQSENEVNKVNINLTKFAMVKLNGDAVWGQSDQQHLKNPPTIFDGKKRTSNNTELLVEYIDRYKECNMNKIENGVPSNIYNPPLLSFNFAWEIDNNFTNKYSGHPKNLEAAEIIAAETEILVVIGYSFPIFNREIDNRLFKKMENLKKVYIQDLDPENIKSTMENAFEVLQQTFQVSLTEDRPFVQFHLTKNINQFVIPFELNQD